MKSPLRRALESMPVGVSIRIPFAEWQDKASTLYAVQRNTGMKFTTHHVKHDVMKITRIQ
jgi:hypothetical protein